jgi:hypothetical protein
MPKRPNTAPVCVPVGAPEFLQSHSLARDARECAGDAEFVDEAVRLD